MNCKNCGNEIEENAKFCIKCGTKASESDKSKEETNKSKDKSKEETNKSKDKSKEETNKSKDKSKEEDIAKYLIPGEVVENTFEIKKGKYRKHIKILATSKRLFIKENKKIRDADYEHISSIQFGNKDYKWLIILGIILIATIFLFQYIFPYIIFETIRITLTWILLLPIPFIMIIIGIVYKYEFLEVTIIGIPTPLKFRGNKSNLDYLFRIVGEKRELKK